jgi:crotonobetainyl-CoA:carnitine CoA-transferase CaiB-like acyl-CoA transferase
MTALNGFRMLTMQNFPPVATAGYLLAEMGMDVIDIEAPNPARSIGAGRAGTAPDPRELAFNILGRNKRSIVLDLKSEDGRETFMRLAETADVILEGFRPGTVQRLGIDYESVRARAPGIVYCSLSGVGQTGPYADIPFHDTEACAAGGATAPNIDADGTPVALGVLLGDAGGGLHAVGAILAALLHRERGGPGQFLDVSMTASMMTFQLGVVGRMLQTGNLERPWPLDLGVLRCGDGKYIAAANTGSHLWERFCRTLELPELLEVRPNGPDWPDAMQRIQDRLATKTRDEWFRILHEAGASVAPVQDASEVMEDPQAWHFGAVIELTHPELGTVSQPGFPVRFSETPPAFRKFASAAGADTAAVIDELGTAAVR